eukprot:3476815-Amphidinium_carterae.1
MDEAVLACRSALKANSHPGVLCVHTLGEVRAVPVQLHCGMRSEALQRMQLMETIMLREAAEWRAAEREASQLWHGPKKM